MGRGVVADYGARDALGGQMCVMSFHVMSSEEVRCYWWFQGMCFRFYGHDLINVLPLFFIDSDGVKKWLLQKYNGDEKWRREFEKFRTTFVDKRFEEFYAGLTGPGQHPEMDVIADK